MHASCKTNLTNGIFNFFLLCYFIIMTVFNRDLQDKLKWDNKAYFTQSVMLGFSAVSLPRVQLHKNFVCLPKDNVQSSSCRYIQQIKYKYFLSFVDRASRYNRVNKNQLNAHLILSIFRKPLHVAGVSRPIFRRYNRMYTIVGTYYSI